MPTYHCNVSLVFDVGIPSQFTITIQSHDLHHTIPQCVMCTQPSLPSLLCMCHNNNSLQRVMLLSLHVACQATQHAIVCSLSRQLARLQCLSCYLACPQFVWLPNLSIAFHVTQPVMLFSMSIACRATQPIAVAYHTTQYIYSLSGYLVCIQSNLKI